MSGRNVVIVDMPELTEGKEGHPVCIVETANIQEVLRIVSGKGLGAMGADDGVRCWMTGQKQAEFWQERFVLLILDLETFRSGIENKQISWHSVIEWQAKRIGTVDRERKVIRIGEAQRYRLSPLWEATGYKIETF